LGEAICHGGRHTPSAGKYFGFLVIIREKDFSAGLSCGRHLQLALVTFSHIHSSLGDGCLSVSLSVEVDARQIPAVTRWALPSFSSPECILSTGVW
jgi:hypothetical protein